MEKSPSRWWDPSSAALFILIILISVWRLTVTDWTDNLGYIINLASVAALVGLALGASRFGKRGVSVLAVGYTLMFIPRQLIAFYDNDIYIGERLISVGGRLLVSIGEFMADKPVKDPLFFITLMGILYWLIALISGYQLVRHNNALAAILPAGLTMLVIHLADRGPAERLWIIALFLLAALTLIGRGKYLRDRIGWVERRVQLAPETGPDLSMGALVGAAALILLAWSLPLDLTGAPVLQKKWQDFTQPWRATRDRFERAFDALEGEGAAERVESFRSSMSLGSRAAQGDATIFKVIVPPEATELPRLYWRARVYDRYENGLWSASTTSTGEFSPEDDELSIPDLAGRTEFEFTITSFTQKQAILSLPAQPVWISRPADVVAFPLPDGTRDVLFLQTFPFLEPGETFRVRAAMSNPSIQELREAGTDYPEWVTARYLQLPEGFSQRVRNYASQITFGLTNPYDITQTVTTVLRAQITYEPNLTLPAAGTDLIEWFLFEGKQGYCNYYATSEVLMLRSLGIPARMAVGFAQGEVTEGVQRPGETEATAREYSVYRKHMHAWPEVYFPGIGWVEFEPTGNQSPLIRPATPHAGLQPVPALPTEAPGEELLPILPAEEDASSSEPAPLTPQQAFWMWTASILTLAVGIYFFNRQFKLTTRAAEYVLSAVERRGERGPVWVRNAALFVLADPFERAFHSVNLNLRWMSQSPASHLTPKERARALKEILPDASEEIDILLKEYHASHYAPSGGDLRAARHASRKLFWRGVRTFLDRIG
ncbi:MAG: transglutaminase-like domain-containing protein [Chloroflexota bacterium]